MKQRFNWSFSPVLPSSNLFGGTAQDQKHIKKDVLDNGAEFIESR